VFSTPEDVRPPVRLGRHARNSRSPFVMVQNEGRGVVAAFTADPNFRAFMDGLNVLFLNVVFRGPVVAAVTWRNGIIASSMALVSRRAFTSGGFTAGACFRPPKRPNILVVMLDDFGIGQCSPSGVDDSRGSRPRIR
jgi:hypothetical protein